MKHTPGPWETSSNGIDWDVCEENGGNMIADLKDCENDEANARLIAKAPEMLETLKDVRQVLESIMLDRPVNVVEALYNVGTLIDKIEGGE